MQTRALRFALLGLVGLAIAGFFWFDLQRYLSLESLKSQRGALQAWVGSHFWLALGGYVGIYVLVAALSLPGAAILTLAGGAIFGLITGTLAVSVASTAGATLAFLGSRFLFRDWVKAKFASAPASSASDKGQPKKQLFSAVMWEMISSSSSRLLRRNKGGAH